MTEEVVGQRYNPEKNQLPYGGAMESREGRILSNNASIILA